MAVVRQLAAAAVVLMAMAVTQVEAALSHRLARQATTCGSGTSCQPLSTCQYFQELLGSLTPAILGELQSAVCQYERQDPRVCCPGSGGVTATATPPTRPTLGTRPTQAPTQATPSPGQGEALLPSSCGKGTIALRINSGEDAPLGAYPWMAVLGYGSFQDPFWGCGGALINERYVVTAAHCGIEEYTSGARIAVVRLGEYHLDTEKDCKSNDLFSEKDCALPVQDIAPEEIINHPDFNMRDNFSDDIALIRLEKPVNLNKYVQPICLPSANLNVGSALANREAVVAGWGATETGLQSPVLQHVKLPFVDLDSCRTHFRGTTYKLLSEQVCFGGTGHRDTCRGDSGGPVFYLPQNNPPYIMLGVVSFGVPGLACGIPGVPAVYTNVASYRAWITGNLKS